MDHRNARLVVLASTLVLALGLGAGCAGAPPPRRTVYVAVPAPAPAPPVVAQRQVSEEWVRLEHTITFVPNRVTLTREGQSALAALADELRAQQVVQVRVDGHVNSRRHTRGGERLSERRARAITERLIEMGFQRELFTTEGHGDQQLVDTDTRHGDQNRRVELSALVRHES